MAGRVGLILLVIADDWKREIPVWSGMEFNRLLQNSPEKLKISVFPQIS